MTTKASSIRAPEAEARTLGIVLAGYLTREREEQQYVWDRNSAVLCLWPLACLGAEEDPTVPG
jgi:hypothetical protein